MSAPNPLESTIPGQSTAVSKKKFLVAGILTIVYGLEQLDPNVKNVACLWLLHPRLGTQESMSALASSAVQHWNSRSKSLSREQQLGFVAVSFDQRNHGSREIDPRANQDWRSGNSLHGQDMFYTYHGTAIDTSQLITCLSSYIFPENEHQLVNHLVLGISLGGHGAWHCTLHDPRITTAIVVIGCPDFTSLMTNRAREWQLETWTNSSPPGKSFIGSKDFPLGLVEAVKKYDPVGFFLGSASKSAEETHFTDPSPIEKERLVGLMKTTLQGKRILSLSGGADKLVPYARSEPFLQWLKRAIGPQGWFRDGGVILEDMVFDGVGHEMSPAMVKESLRFIAESLELVATGKQAGASQPYARL